MAKADIDISIQGGEDSFGVPLFRPNQVIHGNFTVFPDANVKCQHLYARLIWQTEGRGTRFREIIQEDDLFQGEFQAGMPRSFDFQFPLPADPWSHEGHYVSIVWGIEVQIDVAWSKDPKQIANFVLSPEREIDSSW
ncbi:MAG: hypothetical protein DWQ04_12220 [Chloroflexi bacterium]|nr:MAG: hypothetical protein DWQ04_12220 [Chloroflexota bacterium]